MDSTRREIKEDKQLLRSNIFSTIIIFARNGLCTTKAQEIEGFRRFKWAQKKAEFCVPHMGWFSFRFLDVVVGFTSDHNGLIKPFSGT